MFSLCTTVVGYPEADLTTILSQKRQMITGPLSMTSRKVALFTTGKSPLLALKAPLMFTAFLDMLRVWNTPKSTFKMVNEPHVASLHWSSETSAASGHSDCPTIISVDSSQPWSGIRSSTGTGISTERSSVFSYDVSLQHKRHRVLWPLLSIFRIWLQWEWLCFHVAFQNFSRTEWFI